MLKSFDSYPHAFGSCRIGKMVYQLDFFDLYSKVD